MMDHVRLLRGLAACAAIVAGFSRAPQESWNSWYISTAGSDTLSIERVERTPKVVSGVWVSYRRAGERDVLRHEYTIRLQDDGRPSDLTLRLRRPGGEVLRTYQARFTGDSVAISFAPDSLRPVQLAARKVLPLLGRSMGLAEVAISAVVRAKQAPDSGLMSLLPITGPFLVQQTPYTFSQNKSFRIGPAGSPVFHLGASGAIDSLVTYEGVVAVRRVEPFDIEAMAASAAKRRGQ
jgi:hypothetical protein